MNHNNGNPQDSAIRDGFFNTPCTMPVPIQIVPRSEGGLEQDSAMWWNTAHFPISLPCRYLAAITRPARAAPAEKGRTGATPSFLPLYRHAGRGGGTGGGTQPTPPLFRGRSRPIYPYGKAESKTRKRALTPWRQAS